MKREIRKSPDLIRFETENAAALAEVREEKRRLAKLKKEGKLVSPLVLGLPKGTGIIVCYRK